MPHSDVGFMYMLKTVSVYSAQMQRAPTYHICALSSFVMLLAGSTVKRAGAYPGPSRDWQDLRWNTDRQGLVSQHQRPLGPCNRGSG